MVPQILSNTIYLILKYQNGARFLSVLCTLDYRLFFEPFNLFHTKQFGFKKKHSTRDALAEFTEKIVITLLGEHYVSLLNLKAFDTLDFQILLNKLYCYGFRGVCNLKITSVCNFLAQKLLIKPHSASGIKYLNFIKERGCV